MEQQQDNIIAIGLTSKVTTFISKYPWIVMLLVVLITATLVYTIDTKINLLMLIIMLVIVYGVLTLLIKISTSAWCYKVEVNNNDSTIIFYKFFNRGIYKINMEDISVIIDSYCNIIVGDTKFIIHVNFIHQLVAYLPKNTIIEYKGRIGKYKEKEWIKYNRQLIPGNRLNFK
jgi:hypothetical protein